MQKIPRIAPDELLDKINRHANIVILDVRTAKEYAASDEKIAGAIRKSPETVDSWIGGLPSDPEYVTYCT